MALCKLLYPQIGGLKRSRMQGIHVKIKVDADATSEQLEKLRAEVETRCPVSDNIGQATPVSVSLTLQ